MTIGCPLVFAISLIECSLLIPCFLPSTDTGEDDQGESSSEGKGRQAAVKARRGSLTPPSDVRIALDFLKNEKNPQETAAMLLRTLTSEGKEDKLESPIESPDFSKLKFADSGWAKIERQRSLSPTCCSPADFYESLKKALQEFLRMPGPSNPSEGSKPDEAGEVGEVGKLGEGSDHKSE